jgi:predicted NBD/HSP70 family sugar kinase
VDSPRQLDVLRLIRDAAPLTRQEIANRTGVSFSQVSRLTSELLERGLIAAERQSATGTHRPSDLLALSENGPYVVGLDVGGLLQQAVVATLSGRVIANLAKTVPLPTERDAILDHFESLVRQAIDAAKVNLNEVLGLGIGLRGIVNPAAGVVLHGPETPVWGPAWTDFDIRDALRERVPWTQIAVDDTARVLGVAEARHGNGAGESDFLYVIADTGVGSALMIDGRPYVGPSRMSGEIGHLTIEGHRRVCACGKAGCIETEASVGALIERAQAWWDGDGPRIEELIDAADWGDERARKLLEEGGHALGIGLAIVLNLFGPRLIVIGGRLGASAPYRAGAEVALAGRALPNLLREVRIAESALGPLAGAFGAATLVLDELFR